MKHFNFDKFVEDATNSIDSFITYCENKFIDKIKLSDGAELFAEYIARFVSDQNFDDQLVLIDDILDTHNEGEEYPKMYKDHYIKIKTKWKNRDSILLKITIKISWEKLTRNVVFDLKDYYLNLKEE